MKHGKVALICRNNSVIAVVSLEQALWPKYYFDCHGKIFTFVPGRWLDNLETKIYMSGSHTDMDKLLLGWQVVDIADAWRVCKPGELSWSGHVPFSNEEQYRSREQSPEVRRGVVSQVTTTHDMLRVFGPEAVARLAQPLAPNKK